MELVHVDICHRVLVSAPSFDGVRPHLRRCRFLPDTNLDDVKDVVSKAFSLEIV
jgi:hypothetical protein